MFSISKVEKRFSASCNSANRTVRREPTLWGVPKGFFPSLASLLNHRCGYFLVFIRFSLDNGTLEPGKGRDRDIGSFILIISLLNAAINRVNSLETTLDIVSLLNY